MKFTAKIRTAGGTEEMRVIDAPSRFSVYADIEKEGGMVLTLTDGGSAFVLPKWLDINLTSGIGVEERITFTKNLSAMLKAGLTLSRALSVINRQAGNKSLKKVVSALEEEVKKGTALAEALAMHPQVFNKLFVAMTKAGEESGTLADSLAVVARQMERSHTLDKKIKGAMIYPSIILFAIVVIGVLMMIYVVPTLAETFRDLNAELPDATKAVIALSDFMASHVIVVFATLIAASFLMFLFLRSKIGQYIVLAASLRIPVIGTLVRETMSARVARTLSSLLSSGVEMLTAIGITGEVVGENRFGKVVTEAAERVKKGEPLSTAFIEHSKLYPVFVGEMMAVGEETGQVSGMLGQVAEYYEQDVEDGTKDLSTIIEPVLMLIIGTFVGVFAVTMISPIYSLSSQI